MARTPAISTATEQQASVPVGLEAEWTTRYRTKGGEERVGGAGLRIGEFVGAGFRGLVGFRGSFAVFVGA